MSKIKLKRIIDKIQDAIDKDSDSLFNEFNLDLTISEMIIQLEDVKRNVVVQWEFDSSVHGGDTIEEQVKNHIENVYKNCNIFADDISELSPNDVDDNEYRITEYARIDGVLYELEIDIFVEWCGDYSVRGFVTEYGAFQIVTAFELND